jgi:channel protein (hemolysin III family)
MTPNPIIGFADPVSSWSHLLAAGVSLIGTGVLWAKGRGNVARVASLTVFSFALVFLFSMSGVFHLLPRGTVARDVLQRLDHAGIWTLIAATFAPIHIILFRGHRRWLVLLIVWAAAITGLVLEIVFFEDV